MRENETMMNQQQKPSQKTYKEEIFDWRGLAGACIVIPLIYLIGPLVLGLSFLLQRWAASSMWKAPDRWASIRTFAWLCPLIYIPIWLFRDPIALFWSAHLPQLLGPFLLWPPTFDNFATRWVLALALAPALTFILERQRPLTLTMRHMIRRPRPGEVIGPYQEEEVAPQMLPVASGDQAQKPAKTAPRKKASGNAETKAKSPSSGTTTRKKTERDPRPIGVAWAEQSAEEQRRKEGGQRKPDAQSPAPRSERSRAQKAVEPEEELSEEPIQPDPFKAKKFDWRNVKE